MSERYIKRAKKGKGRERKNTIKRIKELIKKIWEGDFKVETKRD